jgi:hypothetical protein
MLYALLLLLLVALARLLLRVKERPLRAAVLPPAPAPPLACSRLLGEAMRMSSSSSCSWLLEWGSLGRPCSRLRLAGLCCLAC